MRNYKISTFFCVQCNNQISLPRKSSRQRERGHLKKIYCVKCKTEVNHSEQREFDWEDFKDEAIF